MNHPADPRTRTYHPSRGARIPTVCLWIGLALLAPALAGCAAARQVPDNLEYAGAAVVDWAGYVVGAQPPEY